MADSGVGRRQRQQSIWFVAIKIDGGKAAVFPKQRYQAKHGGCRGVFLFALGAAFSAVI